MRKIEICLGGSTPYHCRLLHSLQACFPEVAYAFCLPLSLLYLFFIYGECSFLDLCLILLFFFINHFLSIFKKRQEAQRQIRILSTKSLLFVPSFFFFAHVSLLLFKFSHLFFRVSGDAFISVYLNACTLVFLVFSLFSLYVTPVLYIVHFGIFSAD